MNYLRKKKAIKIFAILSFISLIPLLAGIFYYHRVTDNAVLDESLLDTKRVTTIVYDIKGNPIGKDQSPRIDIDKVPSDLIDAFIVSEDRRFLSHNGVDLRAIVRAMIHNAKEGKAKEGASTITQQVIKNTHLTPDKTIERKLTEIKLARDLEKRYTKAEIMETYLNILYFGNSIYGVSKCAECYFGKDYTELTLKECAMIAAVVQNPAAYSPIRHYEQSLERANLIINNMYKCGKIDSNKREEALNERPKMNDNKLSNRSNNAYLNSVYDQAASLLNTTAGCINNTSLSIYTYYDTTVSSTLSSIFSDDYYFPANSYNNTPSASALILDNNTLGVSSYVSNTDSSVFDIKRQIGSLIKPIGVYAPAIDNNVITPMTILNDEPTVFDNNYHPSNYRDLYYGKVNARFALSNSLNIPAVLIEQKMGTGISKQYLDRLNMPTDEKDGLALALGGTTYGYDLCSIAAAYSTLSNQGMFSDASFIREIRDKEGKILYTHTNKSRRVFKPSTAYLVTDMLRTYATSGTSLKLSDIPYLAAKTGTVASGNGNGNSDCWSVAYDVNMTSVVWYGNPTNQIEYDLHNISGGNYPTLVNKAVFSRFAPDCDFPIPQEVVEVSLDKEKALNGTLEYLPSDVSRELCIRALFPIDNTPTVCSLSPLEELFSELSFDGYLIVPKLAYADWSVSFADYQYVELPQISLNDLIYVFIPPSCGDIVVSVRYTSLPEISVSHRFNYSSTEDEYHSSA